MRRIMMLSLAGVMLALSPLWAQQPTCRNCPGTYISNEEVRAYIKRAADNNLTDQQIRAVDIGKINLDVGVVYRDKLVKPADASVAEHDLVSELYHVIDGTATLMLGPDIVGAKRRPADLETVRLFNGPGNNGTSIRNGVSYNLKPGDVVIIPAGTGHWFTPNKSEAESKTYLGTR